MGWTHGKTEAEAEGKHLENAATFGMITAPPGLFDQGLGGPPPPMPPQGGPPQGAMAQMLGAAQQGQPVEADTNGLDMDPQALAVMLESAGNGPQGQFPPPGESNFQG